MSAALRKVIHDSGIAHAAIERETGVKRACVMRFLRGERSLRLDVADKLAEYFDLELRRRKAK